MKTHGLVMVGVMISATIFAQQTEPDATAKKLTNSERMKQDLTLSDAQYASIKGIDSKYADKHAIVRKEHDRRRFEERESLRSLRAERDEEIRKVLTPDQYMKWDNAKADRKAAHRNHYKKDRSRKQGEGKGNRGHSRGRHGE